jgi:hypothetical protein
MKNITVSIDDETYRRARVRAAEQDASVSALIERFLTGLAFEESDREHLKQGSAGFAPVSQAFALATACRGTTRMGATRDPVMTAGSPTASPASAR